MHDTHFILGVVTLLSGKGSVNLARLIVEHCLCVCLSVRPSVNQDRCLWPFSSYGKFQILPVVHLILQLIDPPVYVSICVPLCQTSCPLRTVHFVWHHVIKSKLLCSLYGYVRKISPLPLCDN